MGLIIVGLHRCSAHCLDRCRSPSSSPSSSRSLSRSLSTKIATTMTIDKDRDKDQLILRLAPPDRLLLPTSTRSICVNLRNLWTKSGRADLRLTRPFGLRLRAEEMKQKDEVER